MQTVSDALGANLLKLRKRRGHTVRSLSAKLTEIGHPILPSGITKMEAGTRRCDVNDLVALAVALDVSPVTLLLPSEDTSSAVHLTSKVWAPWKLAWRWMHGESFLPSQRKSVAGTRSEAIAENRPYEEPLLGETRRFLQARDAERPYLITAYGPKEGEISVRMYSGEPADEIASDLRQSVRRQPADKAEEIEGGA
jgi:hypothetical protein